MLAIAVTWLITQAVGATFCTEKDCYEIEQSVIDAKVNQCLYEAQVTMLVLDWKKRNKFKQVKWVAGGKQVVCMSRIPNNFKTGLETQKQLQFLEKIKCTVHNLKPDPVMYQIKYYNLCMNKFNFKEKTWSH